MAGGCNLDLRNVPEMIDEIRDFTDNLILQGSDCPSRKLCVDCGTSKTPLWRGGPAGPKSLCNACGIRSRKKRWALLQMTNSTEKKMKYVVMNTNTYGGNCNSSSSSSSNGRGGGGNSSDSLSKQDKLTAMWEVLKQPPRNVRIDELNEEQQAAVLLMALSHGFNYS